MIMKFKGNKNFNLQIGASVSEDEENIVCGSEDGYAYVWNTKNDYVPAINPRFSGYKKEKNHSIEFFAPFEPEMSVVTVALFAPLALLQLGMTKYRLFN